MSTTRGRTTAATMGEVRQLQKGYTWAELALLEPTGATGRGRVRGVGCRVAFLVLRQGAGTVQCVVAGGDGTVRGEAELGVRVDVASVVSLPREPVRGASQQVEIQVEKLH